MYTFQAYIFSYLLVACNLSVAASTNVLIVQPFCATFGIMGAGFILKYQGRPKWIIVSGYCVNVLGMGLTLRYRDASVRIAPLIVGQGLFGVGQGIVYTIQTAMQASVGESCMLFPPQNTPFPLSVIKVTDPSSFLAMAQVTALYATLGAIGSAFGSAISGSVWISKGEPPLVTRGHA